MESIKVFDYYNHPEYYRYMPNSIFTELESAYLKGCLMAKVTSYDFMKMLLLKQMNEKPQLQ